MRVLFFGTPEFALPSLKKLLSSPYEVVAVVTQPDRPAGRGQRLQAPPVKILAEEAGLPVLQPLKIRDPQYQPALQSFEPDFLVVVAFGQILPQWLLQLPRMGPVNVHASLLPLYRGAAPIQWAIMNGERESGVTTMLMEESLDTGPILLQQRVPLRDSVTAGELSAQLAEAGADLLLPTLEGLKEGAIQPVRQDDGRATYAPRITKEMSRIDFERDAVSICNQIRALNPWPLASTLYRGEMLHVYLARPGAGPARPGTAGGTFLGCSREGLLVQCGAGTIMEILGMQLAGRSLVTGRAFANGARLKPGAPLFTARP